MTGLTPRMVEALEWLEIVGKATPASLRRSGFSTRTFDALVERGLVEYTWYPRIVNGPFPVYRPMDGTSDAAAPRRGAC